MQLIRNCLTIVYIPVFWCIWNCLFSMIALLVLFTVRNTLRSSVLWSQLRFSWKNSGESSELAPHIMWCIILGNASTVFRELCINSVAKKLFKTVFSKLSESRFLQFLQKNLDNIRPFLAVTFYCQHEGHKCCHLCKRTLKIKYMRLESF